MRSPIHRLFAGGAASACDARAQAAVFGWSGDGKLDISDAIAALAYLFLDGPAHASGTACVAIEGCLEGCPQNR